MLEFDLKIGVGMDNWGLIRKLEWIWLGESRFGKAVETGELTWEG